MLLDNCVFIFITATRNKIQNISVTQESAFNASHPKGDHFLIYQLVGFVCYRTSLNKINSTYTLLCLKSFAQHNVFKIHLYCL